jgi:hypothetical protein
LKEVTITLSLLVNENYSQKDVEEIIDDFKEIISMTDSEDIRYEYGEAVFV